MAAGLVLRFEGGTVADYEKVNDKLRIDMGTGQGDWPQGLLSHAAGESGGSLYVMEVWESREAQERFMKTRLGRAFAESGANIPPPDVTWVELVAYHTPENVPA